MGNKSTEMDNIGANCSGGWRRMTFRALVLILGLFIIVGCSDGGDSSGDNTDGDNTGGPGGNSSSYDKSGAYEQNGDTFSETGETYTTTVADQSGVYVYGGGTYSLTDGAVNKNGGDTSSEEGSNFYGLNAVVLAEDESTITLTNCDIYSNADGSNGVFAYGEGSSVYVVGGTIETHENSSRGVDATYGGLINVSGGTYIYTEGAHCGALASDRYETNDPPTIIADDVTADTHGEGSPGIYCTGTFSVSNSTLTAYGSEAAAIEGLNSITLLNSTIEGNKKWGVIIYQSMSGDSSIGTGTFDMSGGELINNASAPVFMVCNTEAEIYLEDAAITTSGSVLIRATDSSSGDANINSDWGSAGGDVTFSATNQVLEGTVSCNELSSIDMTLSGTSDLEGAVEIESGGEVNLTLEDSSTWTATGDSYVDALNGDNLPAAIDAAGSVTIYYDSSDTLTGNHTLSSGGQLQEI